MDPFRQWLTTNGYTDELSLYNELSIRPGQYELEHLNQQLEYLRMTPVPTEPQLNRTSSMWLGGYPEPWDYDNEVNKRNNEIAELENQINQLSQPVPYNQIKSIVVEHVRVYSNMFEGGGLRRARGIDQLNRETMDKYDSLWRAMSAWEGSPSNMKQQISGWASNPFGFGSTKSLNADIVYLKNLK
jgi:hypothetical protein